VYFSVDWNFNVVVDSQVDGWFSKNALSCRLPVPVPVGE
jgi:hypothetical protein